MNNLHQEFRTEYSKTCQPLTQKYLAAVEKRQKQLAQQGNMEEAIAIHNYMKPFRSNDSPVDQVLKGIWKNQGGELYDFSNKSKAAKKNPDGSLKFYLVYTSSSPGGEWKMARADREGRKGHGSHFLFRRGKSIPHSEHALPLFLYFNARIRQLISLQGTHSRY